MNKKAACVKGDIPLRLIHIFSEEFSLPLCNIINSIFIDSTFPDLWKTEYITPAAKIYPPTCMKDFRPLSVMLSWARIADKIMSAYIIEDMSRDNRQYGNEKGMSVNHYLINMLNKILQSVDKNSNSDKNAVIIAMIDASHAFERQSHILGVQSFIDSNVRVSLNPAIVYFFKNIKLIVKLGKNLSSPKMLQRVGRRREIWGFWNFCPY